MDEKLLDQIITNIPELECSCGGFNPDDFDLMDVRYPDSSEIVYVYHCEKCGKEIQETFWRVKVGVGEL